jgi:hypothetical protein
MVSSEVISGKGAVRHSIIGPGDDRQRLHLFVPVNAGATNDRILVVTGTSSLAQARELTERFTMVMNTTCMQFSELKYTKCVTFAEVPFMINIDMLYTTESAFNQDLSYTASGNVLWTVHFGPGHANMAGFRSIEVSASGGLTVTTMDEASISHALRFMANRLAVYMRTPGVIQALASIPPSVYASNGAVILL